MSGIDIVRKILQKSFPEINFNDANVDIKDVNSSGANYTSGLYEITVVQKNKETLHLFGKLANISESLRQGGGALSIYEIEDMVYQKMAPAYGEIQDKHGVPQDERFKFCKLYTSSLDSGKEIFIFENLIFKGYKIFDRLQPFDYQCMFDTTTAMAKFHALGLALEKEQPELYKEFATPSFHLMDSFVDSSRDQVWNHVKTLDEEYRGRLEKFLKDGAFDKLKDFFSRKGKFLIHGAYRGNNIMHKKESNRVDVIPVDYQTIRAGCPMTDLLFFISTSTDEAFRASHFEELVEHYYRELSSYLSKLGVDISHVYPRQKFQDELKEFLPATLMLALTMVPLILVDASDAPETSNKNDDANLNSLFVNLNPRSKERITGYIKDCIRWGIL